MMKRIIIGVFSGFITGFFAAGGGMILIPAFVYILKMNEKEARATTISCILPATIISFFIYFKNQYLDFKLGVLAALGGIIGAFIGSKLLNKLSDRILKVCFVFFLIYVSVRFIWL